MAHGDNSVNRNLRQVRGFCGINDTVQKLQTNRCSCQWFKWKVTALGSALFHTITTIVLGVIALVANLACLCGCRPRTIKPAFYTSRLGAEFAIRHFFGYPPSR
jgi:hypothetical protein